MAAILSRPQCVNDLWQHCCWSDLWTCRTCSSIRQPRFIISPHLIKVGTNSNACIYCHVTDKTKPLRSCLFTSTLLNIYEVVRDLLKQDHFCYESVKLSTWLSHITDYSPTDIASLLSWIMVSFRLAPKQLSDSKWIQLPDACRWVATPWWRHQMETFFGVTGHLCGEFTGFRFHSIDKDELLLDIRTHLTGANY